MSQKPKILVVDDTPSNVKLLADLLGSHGYTVIRASSGLEALQQVAAEQPDLVLLDVVMPETDGFEVCRKLRENPETAILPVIMTTALYPAEERYKGIECGADDFLTYPINQAELLAKVRSLLRIKRLQDEVRSRAGELAECNKKLDERLAEEAKLADVARSLGDHEHDLKNQLMPILSGASLLQDELEELFHRLPERERDRALPSQRLCEEIIKMLTNGAQRIYDQAIEIADCIKGRSSPLHLEACRVTEVVQSVLEMLQVSATQKRVSLRTENLDSLPPIQADQRRLFNAFYNLVNNAIPEVPAGGSVTVRGSSEPEAKAVILSVADTGRGMPAEVRESLFTPRAVSRKRGGTGLGTKIVRDVVDAHGGSIAVESEEGVGTTFYLRLPVEPAATAVMSN